MINITYCLLFNVCSVQIPCFLMLSGGIYFQIMFLDIAISYATTLGIMKYLFHTGVAVNKFSQLYVNCSQHPCSAYFFPISNYRDVFQNQQSRTKPCKVNKLAYMLAQKLTPLVKPGSCLHLYHMWTSSSQCEHCTSVLNLKSSGGRCTASMYLSNFWHVVLK